MTAVPLLKEQLSPVGYNKSRVASFQGNVKAHPVRLELQAMFNTSYLYTDKRTDDWRRVLESSTFAFCPRGWRPTSFRLYEALQLGTIPIYVWEDEKWLPYEHMIDWSEFAFVLERRQISEIADMIAKADILKMQKALADVRHMFTYQYTVSHIIQRVRQLG